MISFGGAIVGPQPLHHVDEILGVAQIGQFRRRGDDDLVGLHQRVLGPAVPDMRNIENQKRRAALGGVDDLGESVGIEIVDPLERRRRRKQRQMLGALGKQAIEIDLVDALRRENGFGNALRRILVEIDVGRSEGKVEIGDDHFGLEQRSTSPRRRCGRWSRSRRRPWRR